MYNGWYVTKPNQTKPLPAVDSLGDTKSHYLLYLPK